MTARSAAATCSARAVELLIEADVFVQNAGAVFAPAFDFGPDLPAALGHLAALLFETGEGGADAAVALFESGELGAQYGVFLADAMGVGLGAFELLAQSFESLLAVGALGVLLFYEKLVLGAVLRAQLFFALLESLEFEAGDVG